MSGSRFPNPDSRPCPVVVLASGRGATFAALLEAQHSGRAPIAILALLSDRRTAPALGIAEAAGIPAIALRPRDFPDRAAFDRALFARAAEFGPTLVILAGYMRIIDTAVVEQWRGRMINLHPSLLPKYPGLDTYARALAGGERSYGASVHYVTSELDGGPVIAQAELPILPDDSVDSLTTRLRPVEQNLLVEVVTMIARGRVVLGARGVEIDGRTLEAPLRIGAEGRLPGV